MTNGRKVGYDIALQRFLISIFAYFQLFSKIFYITFVLFKFGKLVSWNSLNDLNTCMRTA